MLQIMRAYLREMNVSERLADEMLATEPDKVRFLTPSELKAYGLWATDPAEQEKRAIENETRDVQEANKLGLERREYIRRKVLGEHLCPDSEPEFWKCRRRVLQTGGRCILVLARSTASRPPDAHLGPLAALTCWLPGNSAGPLGPSRLLSAVIGPAGMGERPPSRGCQHSVARQQFAGQQKVRCLRRESLTQQ